MSVSDGPDERAGHRHVETWASGTADRGLARALDGLFSAPLRRFVATRALIVGKLERAGKTREAALVERIPKPTRPAWLINQVARREPERLAVYLAAVDISLRARGRDLQTPMNRVREHAARMVEQRAFGALVVVVEEILGETGWGRRGELLGRMEACLRACAEAKGTRRLLSRGWLAGASPAAAPARPARPASARLVRERAAAAKQVRAHEVTHLSRRRAELRASTMRAELAYARAEVEAARAVADRTERALAAARDAVANVTHGLDSARLALTRAERAHALAQDALVSRHAAAALAARRLERADESLRAGT